MLPKHLQHIFNRPPKKDPEKLDACPALHWLLLQSKLFIGSFEWNWVKKIQKDSVQFSNKTYLGVSVTAQMTRVTLGLSQTVDTNALVTQQLSVEGKRTTLTYTLSMAQGGNSKNTFSSIDAMQWCSETLQFIMPDRRSQRPASGLTGAPGAFLVHLR